MYKSPIDISFTNTLKDIVEQQDAYIVREVQRMGVTVDKEELLKALKYDREQYEKGYRDAMDSITHCGDCKYSEPCKPHKKIWCPRIGRYLNADFYCAEGVKKDG